MDPSLRFISDDDDELQLSSLLDNETELLWRLKAWAASGKPFAVELGSEQESGSSNFSIELVAPGFVIDSMELIDDVLGQQGESCTGRSLIRSQPAVWLTRTQVSPGARQSFPMNGIVLLEMEYSPASVKEENLHFS